jgi:hypothetical protein
VGDSPYPASPLSELQVLLRIAEDTASIRGHIRAIDLRQAERGKPDSLPPMRPRLDTHRGLGGGEDVDMSTLAEKAAEKAIKTKEGTEAIAAMTERRKFVVGTIKATISVVAGAVGIKALEWLWLVGHK